MISLHNCDCLEVMRGMDTDSINTIICDPPYYSTDLHDLVNYFGEAV